MNIIDGTNVECSRCGEIVPLEAAVNLQKRHNRAFNRPLCEECLATVGVPKGYVLERDISYLKR